jgi:hypothetical protein
MKRMDLSRKNSGSARRPKANQMSNIIGEKRNLSKSSSKSFHYEVHKGKLKQAFVVDNISVRIKL